MQYFRDHVHAFWKLCRKVGVKCNHFWGVMHTNLREVQTYVMWGTMQEWDALGVNNACFEMLHPCTKGELEIKRLRMHANVPSGSQYFPWSRRSMVEIWTIRRSLFLAAKPFKAWNASNHCTALCKYCATSFKSLSAELERLKAMERKSTYTSKKSYSMCWTRLFFLQFQYFWFGTQR